MFGLLITENSGGVIMKKSDLYFIYALLFGIISNVVDNRMVAGLMAICAILYIIASLVMYYIEDKYN